ncbi:phenylalanine 4-monooxygenase [Stylonychia lemnae]|uniref:phenylalanine 4-monooxygenase n=1 Tax=Stylonychia lemnae TaxID=5949 RepID=A0A078AWJ9_STYLE|nr:phenylalanine 4-monooxygenase [Stylonychia lemnae]|eukprot:CDW85627.1 phenylalanine 4-monooxygenase [Stylonychia lemnae]
MIQSSPIANFSTMNLSEKTDIDKSLEMIIQGSNMNQKEMASSMQIQIQDYQESLIEIQSIFKQFKVDITSIQFQSCPARKNKQMIDLQLYFKDGVQEQKIQKMIQQVQKICQQVKLLKLPEVPWFPQQLKDLNEIGKSVIQTESDSQRVELLYFKDQQYQKRRKQIAQAAYDYKINESRSLPIIQYTKKDNYVWNYCFNRLSKLYKKFACEEFNCAIDQFKKEFQNFDEKIPQFNEVSMYLTEQTGWRLKPVAGMITPREFLNGLAFKVFHCTQHIRHHSVPLYSYEPDLIHELLGHVPMFATKDFSDFSQQIGLASLGVNDTELEKLAAIYFYTIEFGMCREKGQSKAYGAGIMGSVHELEYCVSDKPQILPFNPFVICKDHMSYPLNSIQPVYFEIDSFSDVKKQVSDYCNQIEKPFNAIYNAKQERIIIDREVKMCK